MTLKKKLLKSLLVSSLLVSSLASITTVSAEDYDAEVKEAEQLAEEHEQAAKSLDNIMSQLTDEVADTQTALNNLNKEIERNEQFLDDAVIELNNAHQEMKTLQEEIAVLEENIASRAGKLEEQARKIQVNGTSTSNIDFILNAESLTDILARIDIVSKVVDTNNKMLEDQLADQEAVIEKTEETEKKILQQNAIAEKLEKTSADLESQKVSQEALVVQLQIEQSTIGSERDQLIAQRNDALQRADRLQNEQEEIRLAAAQAEAERQAETEISSPNAVPESSTRPASSSVASAPTTNGNNSSQASTNSNTNSSTNSDSTSNTNSSTSSNNSQSASRPEQPSTPAANPAPAPEPAPKPKPAPAPKPEPTPAPSGNVISIGRQYLGTPYLYGGTTPKAFDCSGYTRHVFSQAGKSIPRTSGAQYASSTKITNPQAGDLVFFGRGSVTHVGIYLGGGRFIGSQTSTGVKEESLTSGYWSNLVIGYGRY